MARNHEITLKQGDLGPPVRARITNTSDQTHPDFTAATITFKVLDVDDSTGELVEVFESPAVVENPASSSGVLRYDWSAGDTDTKGRFRGLFKVVSTSGVPEHYPEHGYIWITVEDAGPTP